MKNLFKKIKEKMSGKIIISLNSKRKFRFKNPKLIKYSLCFGLPFIAAIIGSTLGIIEYNQKSKIKNPEVSVNITTDKVSRRVYLISTDDLTVPLTVSLDKKSTLQEEILDVYNLLKVSSKCSNEYVKGFINDETKLAKVEIKDNILTLDMDEKFLSYSQKDGKVLEALTLSFLQFDEINGVKVLINGKELKKMTNNTSIPNVLTNAVGVNENITFSSLILNKEKQVVFYQRNYDDKHSYQIPVSVYAEKGNSKVETFINATEIKMPTSSLLKSNSLYDALETNQKSNDDYVFQINQKALIDEETVNKNLYDLVSLSLDLMGETKTVSFTLEGEAISVDGIFDLEDAKVSSIIYNSVSI